MKSYGRSLSRDPVDIALAPGIIAELRRKAQDENLALVSLMVELPMKSFIEYSLMPAFIFFFKLLYPFGLANKPVSWVVVAAGGYILTQTQAIRSAGAFANLYALMIDGCTLAAHLKRLGRSGYARKLNLAMRRDSSWLSNVKVNLEMVALTTAYA